MPMPETKPHVCVVGAGVAGLRCADVLLGGDRGGGGGMEKGGEDGGEGGGNLRVTVLEGRERVGGRLCQSRSLDGTLVDLGPNWIHGTADNPILALARKTNTKLHHWDERQAVFDSCGGAVPADEAERCNIVLWGMVAEAYQFSSENRDTDVIPADRSLLDFFEERVDAAVMAVSGEGDDADDDDDDNDDGDDEDDEEGAEETRDLAGQIAEALQIGGGGDLHSPETLRRRKELVLQMAHLWGSFVGTSVARQSLRFFWLEKSLEGEDAFVAETFEKILARVAEPVVAKADSTAELALEFNTVVTAIQSVMTEDGRTRVRLKIAGSEESREFDGVIVTVPLGWLKQNKETFSPALPDDVGLAIDSISYGKLDKVYIKFPKAWWNEEPLDESTSSQSPGRLDTLDKTAITAEDNHDGQKGSFPGFMYWAPAHSSTSKDSNDASAQTCINMAALPDKCSHPTLLFYTYGSASEHIAQLVQQSSSPSSFTSTTGPQLDLKSPIIPSIVNIFKPYFSKLPNYNPSDQSCTPIAVLPTCWAKDELAGYGSYSNFQVGLERGDKDIERLREGMPERRIWFAGEHAAPFIATGTVTGAYWSGERTAERVMEAFKIGDGVKT